MTDNRNDDLDFREVNEEGEKLTSDEKADVKDTSAKDASSDDKKEQPQYEDVCFVCRRPESKAGKMFHLPNNICICDDCMHKTMEAVSQFDYNYLLNNPNLMNELNKNSGGFPNFGFFKWMGLIMVETI